MALRNSDSKTTHRTSTHDGSKVVNFESPYIRFLLLGALILGLVSVASFIITGLTPGASLLIGFNAAALFLCGFDKSVAGSGNMRVPEGVLLAFCLFGGTLGIIAGMCLFRHKIRKTSLIFRVLLILVLQIQVLRSTGFIEAVQDRIEEEDREHSP
jgi:uncharacterized membrane protein YsdA (DUF1294 family)